MIRLPAVLLLVATLVAGCARSRPAFEPVAGGVAEVSAADRAAGEALYPFQGPTRQWGYMDVGGRVAVTPSFDAAAPFIEGRAKVRVGDAYGFIDPTGVLVVPARFTSAEAFSHGRALVTEGEDTSMRYGFVDAAGTVVVPLVLPLARSYREGLALVRFRDLNLTWFERIFKPSGSESTGFLGLDGEVVFDLPGEATSFSEGLAPFSEPSLLTPGRWGYVRPDGSVAIPPSFRGTAFRFSNGLARVTQDGAFGFVDSTGQAAFGETYELAHAFDEGRAAVRVDGRWGYIDTSGALRVAARFERAGPFSEGLAAVAVGGLWGFVDLEGEVVIDPSFTAAQAFSKGLAYVTDSAGSYYIDRSGQPVRPLLAPR